MLYLDKVYAGYSNQVVLKDVSVTFKEGVSVIIGPNGAGKTTMFRVCSGVLKPYKGKVTIDNEDVFENPKVKERMGYLPHEDGLIPNLTVKQNLEFYSELFSIPKQDSLKTISELSEQLEFKDLLNKKVSKLSHGQRKRVAIARVMLHDPDILILDEPTSGLDPLIAKELRSIIKKLNKTVLYSTHNLYEAVELAENVTIIKSGTILKQGSVEELRTIANLYITVGMRLMGDPTPVFKRLNYDYRFDKKGIWVISVKSWDEVSKIVEELVKEKVKVLEVKDIENPLESVLEMLEKDKR